MLLTAAAAVSALAGAAAGAAPAAAAPHAPHRVPVYVALGDSYSAGTGTGRYLADGTACERSSAAFPALVAAQAGYRLVQRACAGALTADVARTQLWALGPATARVTVTAGGNDIGFAHVVRVCAEPAWAADCDGAVDAADAVIARQLPGRLRGLYARIRTRAPHARVVVVGYPRLFDGVDCNAGTFFSRHEMARLNAAADALDARTAAAARSAGFAFVDPRAAFTHHAVCDRPEWLNGLSHPVGESYHPNRLGHAAGYAPLVRRALR